MLRYVGLSLLILITGCEGKDSSYDAESKINLLEADNNRLRALSDQREVSQARYDSCLANAQSAYEDRWQRSCARLRFSHIKEKKLCLSNGESVEACSIIDIEPVKNCLLPPDMADRYDAGLKDSERLCLERLKVMN